MGTRIVSPGGQQLEIGRTSNSHCQPGGNGNDMQLLSGQTYEGRIYVGGSTGFFSPVKGAGDPVVGTSYAHSGATTYEQFNQRVTSLSGFYFGSCGNVSQMIIYQDTVHDTCTADGGDSGAPFYYRITGNNHTYIRGMHVGETLDHAFCYGHRWLAIKSVYVASIVTYP